MKKHLVKFIPRARKQFLTLKGLRSIRLNRAWRLYYFEKESEETVIVKIQRIDKHEY